MTRSRNLVTIPQLLLERQFLTERWLRRLRSEHRVTTYTAGGRVLFDLDEVDSYVEATRISAVEQQASKSA